MKKNYLQSILTIFSIIIVFIAFYYAYEKSHEPKVDPLKFSFQSTAKEKSFDDLKGYYKLVYFGFLSCPEICPTTLKMMSQVKKSLDPKQGDQLKIVFITLDPERDSLEAMKIYTDFFHSEIISFKTDLDSLNKITPYFKVFFKKVPLKGSSLGYTIDHSTDFYLLDKENKVIHNIDHDSTKDFMLSLLKREIKN